MHAACRQPWDLFCRHSCAPHDTPTLAEWSVRRCAAALLQQKLLSHHGLLGASNLHDDRVLQVCDTWRSSVLQHIKPILGVLHACVCCFPVSPPILQARPPPADGLGPPEEVSIASAEASIAQYVGLLIATVLAFVALASKTLEGFSEGYTPWLPLIGTLLTGYFTYEGWYYLQLQNYVNNVQRPQSRVRAFRVHNPAG